MKDFKNFIISLLLWVLCIFLVLPISFINLICVLIKYKSIKGYFLSTAVSFDRWANREFRTLWNMCLIKQKISLHHFGHIEETISSVLGKNEVCKTLTIAGKILCFILNTIDKNHCNKSINYNIRFNRYEYI
jgi:hypothetical protein